MWHFVVGGVVPGVSKAPWCFLVGLFDRRNEGITIRRKVDKRSRNDTTPRDRGPEFSATPLREPQMSQGYVAYGEVKEV
jgi:hypothetical protein